MKHFLALSSILIIVSSIPTMIAAGAGLEWINRRIPPVDLYGVWAGSAADVFVVGAGGSIFHWDGDAWTAMEWSGMADSAEFLLRDIWGAATDDVFAVGYRSASGDGGVILHWNGVAWNTMSAPDSRKLCGIWGSSAADVFAVGEGTVLHWDGNTWTAVEGMTDTYCSVWGSAAADVYIAGEAVGGIIRHWDGMAWTAMSVIPCISYTDIWGAAPDDVFAIGSEGQDGSRLIVHWDGSEWRLMKKSGQLFCDIYGTAPENVFVAGGDDGVSGIILHWDGAMWTVENTGTWNLELHSLFCTGEGVVFTAGNHGQVLRRQEGQWDSLSTASNANIYGVWGLAGDDVFAVGAAGSILHWDGTTCSRMTSGVNLDLFDVSGVAADDVYAVGGDYLGCGIILHWDGAAWTEMPLSEPCTLNGVWCAAADDVFAVGARPDDTGLILHWDGVAWTETYRSVEDSPLRSVWGAASNDVYAVGGVLILHWDGDSWQRLQFGHELLRDIHGASSDDIYITGANMTIYHWDGQIWGEVFRDFYDDGPPGYHPFFNDVWEAAPNDVYAVSRMVHWDGNVWTRVNPGEPNYDPPFASRIWSAGSNDIFLAGPNGLMARWDASYPLGVRIGLTYYIWAGTEVVVMGYLDNPGAPLTDVPVVFALSIGSDFWFWPHWRYYHPPDSTEMDYSIMDVPTGTTPLVIVPPFQMPDIGDQLNFMFQFYGVMLNHDMTAVVGYTASEYGMYNFAD